MRPALFVLALLPVVAVAAGAPVWLVLMLFISAITIIGRSFLRNPAIFRERKQNRGVMPQDHPESVERSSTEQWNGHTETRVIDNRVFLLGLDKLYCDAMKKHERAELLSCARRVAGALHVGPAQVPVEGYYAGDAQLTEYFRLMRTLQELNKDAARVVSRLREFRRLKDVTSSRLYGLPRNNETLFPPPRDALSLALASTFPNWSVPVLTNAAYDAAVENDDCSLVGLAARAKDPVVLTALRESVVLYAELGAGLHRPGYVYDWKVDAEVERASRRFIETFNELFGDELPPPGQLNAERYWHAAGDNRVAGRCVRLGKDGLEPPRYYHWAIPMTMSLNAGHAGSAIEDFWSPEIWTTERYRRDGRQTG